MNTFGYVFRLSILTLLLLPPLFVQAAEEPSTKAVESVAVADSVTREELEGVRSEVATLQELWQRALEKNTARTQRPLILTGLAQLRYTNSDDGKLFDSFSIPALILNFQGNLYRDYEYGRNIDYLFSLVTPSGANADGSADYTVRPLDAYVSYQILPSLDLETSRLQIILGQQKKPFGLEALATEDKKPTIRSAQTAGRLGLDPRDIGIVLKGDLFPNFDPGFRYRVPLIEYSFGALNGNGPNTSDDDEKTDLSARIVLNAPVEYTSIFRGLSLGGSYYKGKKSISKTYADTTKFTGSGDKNRLGVDLAYVNTPIGFTAEYIRGEDGAVTGGTTKGNAVTGTVKSEGYTFTVFFNFGEQFVAGFKAQDRYDDWYPQTLQPFVRFDRFDPNTSVSGDRLDITTLGVNWFLAQTTKLQLNYNFKQEETNKVDNNEFLAQIQYSF